MSISVNLGGWFVLEPFITPVLYQKYPSAIDEWSLSVLMAADTASGGLTQLENHYKTFIVSTVLYCMMFFSSPMPLSRPKMISRKLPELA